MARNRTILDCYTDEPAGLGVPPFLGVWPRYIAGQYRDIPKYLTIDDLRLAAAQAKKVNLDPPTRKTRIDLINHTRRVEEICQVLQHTDQLVIILGVQTPGKYLSARPGTMKELRKLLGPYKFRKILAGPVVTGGTGLRGGGRAETPQANEFDEIRVLSYDDYQQLQPRALKGASILEQIPDRRIIEIETGRGCPRTIGCSFCTEPVKNPLQWRPAENIIEEVKAFKNSGANAFRLGKQSCIFSYRNGDLRQIEKMLQGLNELGPQVLHIDNANPDMVTEERTRLFVKYLTPGSTAAIGAESFDPKVRSLNNLNSEPETIIKALSIINGIGGGRGDNGCPALLPGINILLGLDGETRETLDKNFAFLMRILDEGLMIRRINIRQVVPFPGTRIYEEVGNRFIRKNHRLYASWIEKVRHEIDLPMLRRIFPAGTMLKKLYAETHQGNVTFLRQLGSYPIVVGVRERLPLGKCFNVRVLEHMPRSLLGEIVD